MKKNRQQRLLELTQIDNTYWEEGIVFAGMDEVGRGPLAGNVVAACVIMPSSPLLEWVDDSKKLSEMRREQVYKEIMKIAVFVGVGQATPEEIDEINILNATKRAMGRAAQGAPAEFFLIDAIENLGLPGKEKGIIKGDANCYSIAASSIVAKVVRDRQMHEYDDIYREYGFSQNKGYGTAMHIAALKAHGPCPLHRRSFIKNFI